MRFRRSVEVTSRFSLVCFILLSLVFSGCFTKEAAPAGEGVQELIRQLKEGDDQTRARAAEALGDLGPAEAKEAVPALIVGLRDEYELVRACAADSLGEMGPAAKSAVPDLVSTLRDAVASVREAAKEALRKIDPVAAAKAEGTSNTK